jgi:hypothetical protein
MIVHAAKPLFAWDCLEDSVSLQYWSVDRAGRPMLAFLTAAARDPLLRETTPFVLGVPIGENIGPEQVGNYLRERGIRGVSSRPRSTPPRRI